MCATPETGAFGTREVFATVGDDEGVPDGACLDADGGLWSARYGGGAVQRYLPDGTADIRIAVPASKVTCCCFGRGGPRPALHQHGPRGDDAGRLRG